MRNSKAVWINGTLIIGFLAWAAWQLLVPVAGRSFSDHAIDIARHAYWALHSEYANDIVSPLFYGIFAGVFVLELVIPAVSPGIKRGPSVKLDFIYMLVNSPFKLLVILPYTAYLGYLYADVLGLPAFEQIDGIPIFVVMLLLFIMADFVGWFHHLLRHKIAAVWQFHAVHHSIRRFSVFARYRLHPVDAVFSTHIKFLPMIWFHQYFGEAAMFYMFKLVIDLFAHSQIKTNLGPLRYIFVTPQSHRIHHSFKPEHQDKNFGVALSIWDYIFGTQYRKYDEYPDIGIEDSDYPAEHGTKPAEILKTFAGQMVYPLRVVLRPPQPAVEDTKEKITATG